MNETSIPKRAARGLGLIALVAMTLTMLAAGVALAATINGTTGDDRLSGTAAADTINGFAGNDDIFGLDGADTVQGGPGQDYLSGGIGNDEVFGGQGPDEVYGLAGNDRLSGETEGDQIFAANDGQRDTISCGAGFDRASVGLNDVVDDQLVSSVTTLPGDVVSVSSCERVTVNLQ